MDSPAPKAAPKASAAPTGGTGDSPTLAVPTPKVEVAMEGSLLQAALRMSAMASAASEVHPQQTFQDPLTRTYERAPVSRDESSVLIGFVEVWENANIESDDPSARFTAVERSASWTGRLGGIWQLCQWVETWRLAKWLPVLSSASEETTGGDVDIV